MEADHVGDRRSQLLDAAMVCFSRKGFHQTTIQDISAEAGVSVGLLYRYFENKDAVIAAMGEEHRRGVQEMLVEARKAGTLKEALEVFFSYKSRSSTDAVQSAFVVDLMAEASRNPQVVECVREVMTAVKHGLTELISNSREPLGLPAADVAELLIALKHGSCMADAYGERSGDERDKNLGMVNMVIDLLMEDGGRHVAGAGEERR